MPETLISSQSQALPVCLFSENPNRLVSLWDIVNKFDAARLCQHVSNFANLQAAFTNASAEGRPAPPEEGLMLIGQLIHASRLCEVMEMLDVVHTFNRIQVHLAPNLPVVSPDASVFAIEARHAREFLITELQKRRFLFIAPERAAYLDQDALFGKGVFDAFPSARPDIREGGNCLAADCGTAAVFHLMRAVEWGLRALCVDLGFRRLRTKNRKTGKVTYMPLGWTDWETILNQLKAKVTERVGKTKRGPKKQLYQEFYYPALQDIEGIKDAWRNHVMHTRREYTPKGAGDVFDYVRRLLVNLSSRVSEC